MKQQNNGICSVRCVSLDHKLSLQFGFHYLLLLSILFKSKYIALSLSLSSVGNVRSIAVRASWYIHLAAFILIVTVSFPFSVVVVVRVHYWPQKNLFNSLRNYRSSMSCATSRCVWRLLAIYPTAMYDVDGRPQQQRPSSISNWMHCRASNSNCRHQSVLVDCHIACHDPILPCSFDVFDPNGWQCRWLLWLFYAIWPCRRAMWTLCCRNCPVPIAIWTNSNCSWSMCSVVVNHDRDLMPSLNPFGMVMVTQTHNLLLLDRVLYNWKREKENWNEKRIRRF